MKTKPFAWVSSIAFLVSAISEWGLDIDLPLSPALWLVMAAVGFFATNAPAVLTTNSWTSSLPGNWHDPFSWSAGVPSNNQTLVRIVNSGSKVVLISSATATVPGTMTISNLLLSAAAGATNTLHLTDPGTNVPLRIRNILTLTAGGALEISNGMVQVENVEGTTSFPIQNDGLILLNSPNAWLINTNASLAIGSVASGRLTTSNGTMVAQTVVVGQGAGSNGTLTMAGGTNQFNGGFVVGSGGQGTVWVTGGRFVVPNTGATIGDPASGEMVISNGSVAALNMTFGSNGGEGTLTMAGGTNELADFITLGDNGTGTVWMTGGQLLATNSSTSGTITIGSVGTGTMAVTNGTVFANFIDIARLVSSQGTMTLAGGRLVMTNLNAGTLNVGFGWIGQMTISGGTGIVNNVLVGAQGGSASGTVWMTSGLLDVSAGNLRIGSIGTGQMTLSNGVLVASNMTVSTFGGRGTFTMTGGTNQLTSSLTIGSASSSSGTVWLTGGRLVATNATTLLGADGTGRMTISNGIFLAGSVHLGANTTASGTLTVAGGTNALTGPLIVGGAGTGTVWVTSGQLVITNTPSTVGTGSGFIVDGLVTLTNGSSIVVSNVSTIIGNTGSGSLTNFGGSFAVTNLVVGNLGGSAGNLILPGGTNTVSGNLLVGNFACSSIGNVVVSGGRLSVTNVAHTAVLDVRSGTVLQNSGTLVIDKLVITNACGHFNHTGGTLSITTTNLAAGLDADGDGLPNDWEQSHGLSPFDNTGNNGASGDPDGDGYSNLQEYLGGSDPHSAASVPDAIWINGSSGKWEVGGNWLIAVPPTNNQSVFITNASPKTVTIDAATPTNNMTIKNLTLAFGDSLQITNTGTTTPLQVLGNVTINSLCSLSVEDGAVSMDQVTIAANGILSVKNAAASIGDVSILYPGQLSVTNGSLLITATIDVQSELSLVDSIVTNWADMLIENPVLPISAEVWVTGGLFINNGSLSIGGGAANPAQMTVSNGYVRIDSQLAIGSGGGVGNLTCAGGTTEVSSLDDLLIGGGVFCVGSVWLTGGQLIATNFVPSSGVVVGSGIPLVGQTAGKGQMTVSNGTARLLSLAVGLDRASGTITINGGTVATTNLTLGAGCTGTGTVIVAGGSLFVTNASGAATLNVFGGAVNLNSGTLIVDRLVITNGCGHFVRTGGTLIQNNPPILGAGLDADGDGLPNDWEQAHGLDPLDPTGNNGATGDPDGDGFTNLQEFQRGTDPQNLSSTPFRITSILQQGNDVLLTWTTLAGTTNQVQATNGSGGNFATNGFADLSGQMFIGGSGLVTTNYTDTSGATNSPARYYRIRLVP